MSDREPSVAERRESPRAALRRIAEQAREMHRLYPFTKTRSRIARAE